MSSSSTRRQQQERDNEYISNTQQQHEATIHSIDMTKDNIRRSIEEVRRETPRYSQTVTDFQNETADASVEIADNFLESQKEVNQFNAICLGAYGRKDRTSSPLLDNNRHNTLLFSKRNV
jgi:GTP1/Obg family GTP-binding protein